MRKGTQTPYFSHLLAVASIVLENGGTEDEVIAALLHHAVEDQGGSPQLEDIRTRFGPRIAEIVEACERAFDERIHPAVYSTFSEIGIRSGRGTRQARTASRRYCARQCGKPAYFKLTVTPTGSLSLRLIVLVDEPPLG